MNDFLFIAGALILFYILAQLFSGSGRSNSEAEIALMRKGCSNKLERKVFDHLVQLGVIPIAQRKVGKYRLDFALVGRTGVKLDIEVDGYIYHSTPKAIAKDRARDKYMKSEGWTVIRLKEEDLKEDFQATMRKAEIAIYDADLLPETHPAMQLQTE